MNILTIPLRCARRKPMRTLVLLLVFTLGVTAIVALQNVSKVVGESLERKLTAFGANILITPKSESLSVSYGGLQLGDLLMERRPLDLQELQQRVHGIALAERLSAVAPKLAAVEQLTAHDGEGEAVGLIGVDWPNELQLKSYWAIDGDLPEAPGDIIAGSAAAKRLALKKGDSVELHGEPFTVAGILSPTGGDDDKVLFLDIAALQRITDRPGQADFVEVAALCAGCPIEDIVSQLGKALPGAEVKALRSVVQQRMYSVNYVQRLVMTVSIVILLTGCCMVGLSMLSAVNERRKEIGILRSLGYSKGRVFGIFCVEALLLGLLAGALGYGLGLFAGFEVVRALDIADAAAASVKGIAFSASQLAATCAGVALVSVLAAAFPALKAAKVDPSEALTAL